MCESVKRMLAKECGRHNMKQSRKGKLLPATPVK